MKGIRDVTMSGSRDSWASTGVLARRLRRRRTAASTSDVIYSTVCDIILRPTHSCSSDDCLQQQCESVLSARPLNTSVASSSSAAVESPADDDASRRFMSQLSGPFLSLTFYTLLFFPADNSNYTVVAQTRPTRK